MLFPPAAGARLCQAVHRGDQDRQEVCRGVLGAQVALEERPEDGSEV